MSRFASLLLGVALILDTSELAYSCDALRILDALQGNVPDAKAINTVGPKTAEASLREFANTFRINGSHLPDPVQAAAQVVRWRRALQKTVGALLFDLGGPKSRTRNEEPVPLHKGQEITLYLEGNPPPEGGVSIPMEAEVFQAALANVRQFSVIKFDDGRVVGEIKAIDPATGSLTVRIREVPPGYQLQPRRGVNYPHTKLGISSITAQDEAHMKMLAFLGGVEVVAISFVSGPQDVTRFFDKMNANFQSLRQIASEARPLNRDEIEFYYSLLHATDEDKYPLSVSLFDRAEAIVEYLQSREFSMPKAMAKIETPEAMTNLKEIVKVADMIMVARGDLGVEVGDGERLKKATATITRIALEGGKPVIVATGMMRSMMKEGDQLSAADKHDINTQVSENGAHGIMTSEETAVGDQPSEVMLTQQLELIGFSNYLRSTGVAAAFPTPPRSADPVAFDLVQETNDKYLRSNRRQGVLVMAGADYETVRRIIAYRPIGPVFVAGTDIHELRQLNLLYGVHLLHYELDDPTRLQSVVQESVSELGPYKVTVLTPDSLKQPTAR